MSSNKTLTFKYRRDTKKLRTENVNFKLPSTYSYQQEISIEKLIKLFREGFNCQNTDILILLKGFPKDKLIDFYLDDEGIVHLEDAIIKNPIVIKLDNTGELKLTTGDSINEQLLTDNGFETKNNYIYFKSVQAVSENSIDTIVSEVDQLKQKQQECNRLKMTIDRNERENQELVKKLEKLHKEKEDLLFKIRKHDEKTYELTDKIKDLEKYKDYADALLIDENIIKKDKYIKPYIRIINEFFYGSQSQLDFECLKKIGFLVKNPENYFEDLLKNFSESVKKRDIQSEILYFLSNRDSRLKSKIDRVIDGLNSELHHFKIKIFVFNKGDKLDLNKAKVIGSIPSDLSRGTVVDTEIVGIEDLNANVIYKAEVIISE